MYKPIKNFISYELWKFFMNIIAIKIILIFISIFNYCNFGIVINIYIFTFYRFE